MNAFNQVIEDQKVVGILGRRAEKREAAMVA